MIKLQQYHVFKLNTSRIDESNCNVANLTVAQARLNGELIQIGDNQTFRMIRKMYKKEPNLELLEELISKRELLKQEESSEEISGSLINKQKQIDEILFIPDVVNVKVDDRRVYKKIFKEGFIVNGITFKRFCSGSGQSRRSTASFVNVEIKEELERRLNCGLNIKTINVAKYNAYFGLYLSGTYPVRTPKVCLIDDCKEYEMIKTVDWIEDVETIDENGKKVHSRKIYEKNDFNFIPDMWDGQGLISPEMAEKWQDDLGLDYLPSQFGIRSSFIKGMTSVFDFKKFAKDVAKKDKIIDHYGETWDISEIDILLSTSMFKMYKFYNSWDEFIQLQEHHGHTWGVTKVNQKFDNEMSLLNYQYIQTLSLDKNKINELITPTVEWIEKICSGEKLYTLLFLLGISKETDTVAKIFDKTNSSFTKAILYNDALLKDPYIRTKIYNNISTKIQDSKVGRVWEKGNYMAMTSDPYGQAQWAFGMEVTGLLKENEHYSHFWNERNITKVDACRSPMVDFHEHNILNLKNNEQMREWYKYLKSGVIYNVWGVDTIRHSDSDWDYDIVFTTSSNIMMENIFPSKNVITYDKVSAPSQRLNNTNILKTDLRSFDSKVGTITNYSTSFITMLANFKIDTPEHNELLSRIKILRRYIGDAIDQAKGIKMKPFPSEWKKRKFIYDDDTEETKQGKYYHNRLVANKKPYFMIYVYDRLRNEYREYKKKCERTCKEKFGCTLEQLLKKKDKTRQESHYSSEYYRRMPVVKNQSVMNTLCGMIEAVDFKYKRPKNNEHVDEMFKILFDEAIGINEDKLTRLIDLYNKFKKKRHFKKKNNILDYMDFETEKSDEAIKANNEFYNGIRDEAYEVCSNEKELANHLVYIVYLLNKNDSKEFAWSIGSEGILSILKDKCDMNIEMPMLDKNGAEYLGKRYSLRSVVI